MIIPTDLLDISSPEITSKNLKFIPCTETILVMVLLYHRAIQVLNMNIII